jgi:hypothetical protein
VASALTWQAQLTTTKNVTKHEIFRLEVRRSMLLV